MGYPPICSRGLLISLSHYQSPKYC